MIKAGLARQSHHLEIVPESTLIKVVNRETASVDVSDILGTSYSFALNPPRFNKRTRARRSVKPTAEILVPSEDWSKEVEKNYAQKQDKEKSREEASAAAEKAELERHRLRLQKQLKSSRKKKGPSNTHSVVRCAWLT